MQSVMQPSVENRIESAGVDWLTATAQQPRTQWDMIEYARAERRRILEAGAPIKAAYRLGYLGWATDGFFFGSRDGGTIIVASGAVAHRVFEPVSLVSDHISRIDLQTTISTPNDRPHLGIQAYSALKTDTPRKVRLRNVTIIETQPQGETCTLGKRTSDSYGRIYDKASEAQLGPPRSLWRYEVEFKRRAAMATASRLLGSERRETLACSAVFDWFNSRGVAPVFTPDPLFCPQNPAQTLTERNILTWFEASLSITVNRAIVKHGLKPVLDALGLSSQVDVKQDRR